MPQPGAELPERIYQPCMPSASAGLSNGHGEDRSPCPDSGPTAARPDLQVLVLPFGGRGIRPFKGPEPARAQTHRTPRLALPARIQQPEALPVCWVISAPACPLLSCGSLQILAAGASGPQARARVGDLAASAAWLCAACALRLRRHLAEERLHLAQRAWPQLALPTLSPAAREANGDPWENGP